MEAIDNRSKIFELDEIYKYKDLIDATDKEVIKEIICDVKEDSNALHQKFLKLVAMEVNHELNKSDFTLLKNKLIRDMKAFLEN